MQTARCSTGQALCFLYNRRHASGIGVGRVTPPCIIHLFTCVTCCWRINYLWTTLRAAAAHARTSRSEQIFMVEVWLIPNYVEVTQWSPWPRRDKKCASISVDLDNILDATAVLLLHAQAVSFRVYRPSVTTHCKHKMCGLLNIIKSGRNDYCPPRNPSNVNHKKLARGGNLGSEAI